MNCIEQWMAEKGVGASELARLSGLSASMISRISSGQRAALSVATALKLHKATRIPLQRICDEFSGAPAREDAA